MWTPHKPTEHMYELKKSISLNKEGYLVWIVVVALEGTVKGGEQFDLDFEGSG